MHEWAARSHLEKGLYYRNHGPRRVLSSGAAHRQGLRRPRQLAAVLRFTTQRIDHLFNHERFHTYHGDLADSSNLHRLISRIEPDEVYNLGAQSHVAVSFEVPEYTAEVDAVGTVRLLDAIRDMKVPAKFYQASTSELFGGLRRRRPRARLRPSTQIALRGGEALLVLGDGELPGILWDVHLQWPTVQS